MSLVSYVKIWVRKSFVSCELDCEESWALKNWCLWTVVLEKTLESPLDCKEIQPVHPKGDLSWVFTGRTDAEAETPVFWPPYAKSWLIGKDLDAGRGWGQEEKGTTREWDGWMASLTRQTWVWVNSGSWWWTGRPGLLQFMGSQRVGHDWATELNWILSEIIFQIFEYLTNISKQIFVSDFTNQKHNIRLVESENKLSYSREKNTYLMTFINSTYTKWLHSTTVYLNINNVND